MSLARRAPFPLLPLALALAAAASPALLAGQAGTPVTAAGRPAELAVRAAGAHAVRVTLRPLDDGPDLPFDPALAERPYPAPALRLRSVAGPVSARVGALRVAVRADPLTVTVARADGSRVQELVFREDGTLRFRLGDGPVLGLGEGGPRPARGSEWRSLPVEFDRRGRLHAMVPRWQSDAYGSRNPVPLLVGTAGWGLFVGTPWGAVDLRDPARGVFLPRDTADVPRAGQTQRDQQGVAAKGIPPRAGMVPGLYDVFVLDARRPEWLMKDLATITGPAVMPPRWAMGYMQSHRTLRDEAQMIAVVDTFRAKRIPVDAVIYLGTGFVDRGWNTKQPSFAFNPEVFHRPGAEVISDLHDRHVKVVLHMVPYDRDRLPTLHGSIPPAPGEAVDAGHLLTYWRAHEGLVRAGVDAFWPDEGDWFDLDERMERHRMYYEGPLSTTPGVRPWSLHRNGYLGIARWGGWVWSGDTQATWKTLEAQVAVGINHSLSLSPYWGSDIGGFYPTDEKTGELYARWFQFGAFCPSFRAHGRTWHVELPWGWGSSDMGVREGGGDVPESAMGDPRIEPVAKAYDELRYRLLPYNYTLAWEARDTGMPLMRALWLEFPGDERARGLGSEYMWGPGMLIAPVFEKGAASRDVYLPAGRWYDWWTGEAVEGGRTVTRPVDLATMPIYVRAGSVLPLDPVRQYTAEPVSTPTTLRVYPGADGEFTLYEDDGASQAYLRGGYALTRMRWDDGARALTLEPAGGTAPRAARTFVVELQPGGPRRTVRYEGRTLRVRLGG